MIARLLQFLERLLASFRGPQLDKDLNAEMASHLDFAIEENLQRGMSAEEARRQALIRFGGIEQARLQQRDARALPFLDVFRQDLQYAFRKLRRDRIFAAIALSLLALGIGANTAMFSIIQAVLLKPLPYPDPDRLLLLSDGATPIRFDEVRAASRSYSGLGAYANGLEDMALSGVADPEVLKAARVSSNFLQILGERPLLGRAFLPQEDAPGAPAVALLSVELWQRRFNRDPLISGKTMMLAGMPYTVVGVLPAHFHFPFSHQDLWVTRPSEWSVIAPEGRPLSPILSIFGRLQPEVVPQQADAELQVLNRQYQLAHPGMLDTKPDEPQHVIPLKISLISDVRSELWMLFAAVGSVLLIVCANLASLLLSRASSRSRELAVRAAIGAGRRRIVRQLLTESVLLASLGGGLGVLLAAASLNSLRHLTLVELPRAAEIRLDSQVLAFAAALSLITSLLFGLAPAMAASRTDLAGVLRGSGEAPAIAGIRASLRLGPRSLLVIAQVAVSVTLLIGATLLIESLGRVYKVDPGFDSSNLLTMRIALPPARYDTDAKKARFYDQLIRSLESLPGVRGAALSLTLPMMDTWMGAPVQLTGSAPLKLNERPIAIIQDISSTYFRTMQISLKRGREFTAEDRAQSAPVAVASENLVRLFWPQYPAGPDPIGDHILVGSNPQPVQIVGIVGNVRGSGRDDDPKAEVYLPCAQKPPQSAMLVVRTAGDPRSFLRTIRNQVLAIDHDQPLSDIATMTELTEASEGPLRLMMMLLGTFAGVATLIAAIGIYGVIAYSVGERTREMGIRRALGAERVDILSLVVGQGLQLAAAGILLGIGGALALTRLLQDLLFRINTMDPLTFLIVTILFTLVAILASYIPARRAIAIDPMAALRMG